MPPSILTGDPVLGKMTYFALGSATAPTVPDDISDFFTSVEPDDSPDEQDATTFRNELKRTLAGTPDVGYTLNGYYSPEAHAFLVPLRGMTDVAFEYGPSGNDVGMTKISGTCTVMKYADPSSSVDGGPIAITVELKILTRTDGTFAAAELAAAEATPAGMPARRSGRR